MMCFPARSSNPLASPELRDRAPGTGNGLRQPRGVCDAVSDASVSAAGLVSWSCGVHLVRQLVVAQGRGEPPQRALACMGSTTYRRDHRASELVEQLRRPKQGLPLLWHRTFPGLYAAGAQTCGQTAAARSGTRRSVLGLVSETNELKDPGSYLIVRERCCVSIRVCVLTLLV